MSQKQKVVRGGTLAALWVAWLHGWALRPDPRLTGEDAAILGGLLAAWLLQRHTRRR